MGPIFTGICFGICALVMIGIGISNIKSRQPVGFYSGEKGPDEDKLKDKVMWNKKHGYMWTTYGVIIVLTWVCGLLVGDGPIILLPFTVGLLGPIPFMIWYHNKLTKEYVIK